MSYSAFLKQNLSDIIQSGSLTYDVVNTIVSSSQLFEWVSIPEVVNIGDVYSYVESVGWVFSNIQTDEYAEVAGVVEDVTYVGTSSLAKLIYKGKISFEDTDITLQAGKPYFLKQQTNYPQNNIGPIDVRNVSINEPLESKPIYIAISNKEAVVFNFRGHVNTENINELEFVIIESDKDCPPTSSINVTQPSLTLSSCIGTSIGGDVFVYPVSFTGICSQP